MRGDGSNCRCPCVNLDATRSAAPRSAKRLACSAIMVPVEAIRVVRSGAARPDEEALGVGMRVEVGAVHIREPIPTARSVKAHFGSPVRREWWNRRATVPRSSRAGSRFRGRVINRRVWVGNVRRPNRRPCHRRGQANVCGRVARKDEDDGARGQQRAQVAIGPARPIRDCRSGRHRPLGCDTARPGAGFCERRAKHRFGAGHGHITRTYRSPRHRAVGRNRRRSTRRRARAAGRTPA
jgi:hypothetical protein